MTMSMRLPRRTASSALSGRAAAGKIAQFIDRQATAPACPVAKEGTDIMPLDKATKTQIIKDFGRADGDTGSPEVQIALLTERIKQLTEHLKAHNSDEHSRPRAPETGWPAAGVT